MKTVKKKLLIIVDMEGIAGISMQSYWNTVLGHPFYFSKRRLLVKELNVVIKGALESGVLPEEIVVADWHWTKFNFFQFELPHGITIIRKNENRILEQGIMNVFLIGFHARAKTNALYSHTFSYAIKEFIVDGREIGEVGMWAYNAGFLGIPITFMTGDSLAIQEIKSLGLKTICVETKNEREIYPTNFVYESIAKSVKKALSTNVAALPSTTPFRIKFSFYSPKMMKNGEKVFRKTKDGLFLLECENAHIAYSKFRSIAFAYIKKFQLFGMPNSRYFIMDEEVGL